MSDWQWVQLNVGLERRHHSALVGARQLFSELFPLTLAWRETGQLQCFFFMRKPPDIRLRFLCKPSQQVMEQLTILMHQLHQQNTINQSFFSQYEPEYDRFGGIAALTYVHHYFDRDTTQWWALDVLKQQSKQIISDEVLLIIILQDLFQGTSSTPNSALRTWQKLGNFFHLKIQDSELDHNFLSKLRVELKILAEEEHILQSYLGANAELLQNLHHLWQTNNRMSSLIDSLASIGQFTLHRHGFDATRIESLIEKILKH